MVNVSPYHLASLFYRGIAPMLAPKRLLTAIALTLIGSTAAQAAD
jgi:hypothetical protein